MAGTVDVGTLLVKYQADTGQLTAATSQAKDALNSVSSTAQSSGGGVLGGFGKMISGAAGFAQQVGMTIFGVKQFGDAAIGLGQALLAPAATAETTQLSFETLLHSTSAAKKEMQDLNTYAAGTPMQTQWVDNAAAKILAFGGKVGDVKPEITAIGDSLSGLGKLSEASLNSIVDIFGKISAQGKITGGDMMQLSTWGIPAWQALSNAMHKPIPELQKMVSAGLIPASQALPALEQGMEKTFGGGMAKQANTFTGLMSTLASNWQIAMAAIGGPALKLAETALSKMGNVLASPAFQQFATNVGQKIADVFSKIGTFVKSNVVPAFEKLGPLFGQIGAYIQGDNFQAFVADVQTLGNQLVRLVAPLQGAQGPLGDLASNILPVLGNILANVVVPALDAIIFPLGQFVEALNEGNPWAQAFADALIGVGVAMLVIKAASIVSAIADFISILPVVIGLTWAWVAGLTAAAIEMVIATWPVIAIGAAIALVVGGIILAIQHWGAISKWLQGAWSGVAGFFGGIWHSIQGFFGGVGNWFHDRFTDAQNGVKSGFGNTSNWFQQQGQIIQQNAQAIGQGVVNAFNWMYQHNYYFKAMVDGIKVVIHDWQIFLTMVWSAISSDATRAWSAITSWISAQWNKLSTLASAVFTVISGFITSKIQYAVTYITAAWAVVQGWLAGEWAQLQGLAQTAWNGVVAVFTGLWGQISSPLASLWTNISGWFSNLASAAFSWGANIIQGIINGIGSMFSALGSAASGAAGTVAQYLGFHSPAKQGPGKELDIWGPNLVKGFAAGIDRTAPLLQASVSHLMTVGTYPIRPSAIGVAASSAQFVAASGSTSDHTTIVELDGYQLATLVQKKTDRLVRLKLGAKGRSI